MRNEKESRIGGCQMTQVEMIYDDNIIIGFRMKGHAGFNHDGPDILCASLSTASQMTINGLLDWTGLNLEDIVKESNEKEALLYIRMPSRLLYVTPTVQQLFKSFEMYVEQLSDQYSDYVSLERRQKE